MMKRPQDTRDAPYPLRMPDSLRQRLERSARKQKRSLHAEILHRLAASLGPSASEGGPGEIPELLTELDRISQRLRVLFEAGAGRDEPA